MSKSNTQYGASAILKLNGKTVGLATSFSWTVDYGKRALYGIDQPQPQEFTPGVQRVSGTIGLVRVRGSGGAEGLGLVGPQWGTNNPSSGVLVERYIHLLLLDRTDGSVIFECERATITSQSWTAGAKDIIRGTLNFEGFFSTNETLWM